MHSVTCIDILVWSVVIEWPRFQPPDPNKWTLRFVQESSDIYRVKRERENQRGRKKEDNTTREIEREIRENRASRECLKEVYRVKERE